MQFTAVAKRDSNKGSESLSRHVLIADAGSDKTWVVEVDAEQRRLKLSRLLANGSVDTAAGVITLDLSTLTGLGLTNVDMQIRELHWKDATTCVEYKAAFLMTEPEIV